MNIHTVDIAGTQFPLEDTECRENTEQNTEGISRNATNIENLADTVDEHESEINTLQANEYITRRRQVPFVTAGNQYLKISNLFSATYYSENVFAVGDRNGEYYHFVAGVTDSYVPSLLNAIRFAEGTNKIGTIYQKNSDIYVIHSGFSNFRIQQIAGDVVNIDVSIVSSIPSDAIQITKKIVQYA